MLLLRLALSEITQNKKFTLVFILQLCLGLTGFIFLNSFRTSFHDSLNARSRQILTADLSIRARRMLTSEETSQALNALPGGTTSHGHISMYSMVASESGARLVDLQGIQPGWPFYGSLTLRNLGQVDGLRTNILEESPVIWVYPEVLIQLGIEAGDSLKIGDLSFTVSDVILDDPGTIQAGVSFAPRVYMGHSWLMKTGLIQKGSTLWNTYYFRLPDPVEKNLELLTKNLNEAISDPGVRITSHELRGERTGRMIRYLFDYLGLVALAGFFLAGLGIAYFYYSFFTRRLREIAVMMSLGLSPARLLKIFLIQVSLLSLLAAFLSLGISFIMIPFIPDLFAAFYKVPVAPVISVSVVGFTLVQSFLGSLLICYPFLRKLLNFSPSGLFQERGHFNLAMSRKDIVYFAPAFLLYWFFSVVVSHSLLTGSLFCGTFLGSAAILSAAFSFSAKKAGTKTGRLPFVVRSGFQYLFRKPSQSVIAFLSMALGSLLIGTILQLSSGIKEETGPDSGGSRPDYFLFDIQPEQTGELKHFLEERRESLTSLSPMISARLLSINEKAVTRETDGEGFETREGEQSRRMRNRSYNLSYRSDLSDSEKIVSGRFFSGPFTGAGKHEAPQISLEQRFASRIGAGLGDSLTFDVQGVSFTGLVTSLRTVKWTSFQPNFFIQFQPGVLEDAPKTWVAGVKSSPQNKLSLQKDLVRKFANISVIDVERVIEKIMNISDYMQKILVFMALLTLVTGFMILCFICQYQSSLRIWDWKLLHVLGSHARQIQLSVVFEFAFLSLMASACGTILATIVSQLLSHFIFQTSFSIHWQSVLSITLAVSVTGALISWLVALFSVRRNLSLNTGQDS